MRPSFIFLLVAQTNFFCSTLLPRGGRTKDRRYKRGNSDRDCARVPQPRPSFIKDTLRFVSDGSLRQRMAVCSQVSPSQFKGRESQLLCSFFILLDIMYGGRLPLGEMGRCGLNIARIANAVTITLYSKVTMQLFILLFSIVKNVISVSSVKSQVTKTFKKSEHFQKI